MNSTKSPLGSLLYDLLHLLTKEELIARKEEFDNDFVPIISTILEKTPDGNFDYEVNGLVMEVFRSVDNLYQHVLTNK